MKTLRVACLSAVALGTFALQAADQVWNSSGASDVWSTNAANWADGAVWTNGNSAVFGSAGGLGETVDISATVTVASVTFQTNGSVVADEIGRAACRERV